MCFYQSGPSTEVPRLGKMWGTFHRDSPLGGRTRYPGTRISYGHLNNSRPTARELIGPSIKESVESDRKPVVRFECLG